MDKEYKVENNQLKVETVIPERTIPERVIPSQTTVRKYSLEQIQREIDRLTPALEKTQTELTEWQAAKKAALDGGMKTEAEIKEAIDAIKNPRPTPAEQPVTGKKE